MQPTNQGSFLPWVELPRNIVNILTSSGFQGKYAWRLTKVKFSCTREKGLVNFTHIHFLFPLRGGFGGKNESHSMFCGIVCVSVPSLIDPYKTHTLWPRMCLGIKRYTNAWSPILASQFVKGSFIYSFIRSAIQRTLTACCLQGFVGDARHKQVIKTTSLPLRSHCLKRETGKSKQFQMGVGPPGQAAGSQGSLLRGGDTRPVFEGEFAT